MAASWVSKFVTGPSDPIGRLWEDELSHFIEQTGETVGEVYDDLRQSYCDLQFEAAERRQAQGQEDIFDAEEVAGKAAWYAKKRLQKTLTKNGGPSIEMTS